MSVLGFLSGLLGLNRDEGAGVSRSDGRDFAEVEGLQCVPDQDILQKALNEHRIVLTVDLDFPHLLAINRSALPSVVLFRLQDETPASIISRLQTFLGLCEAELRQGAVLSVSKTARRLRRLPLTGLSAELARTARDMCAT